MRSFYTIFFFLLSCASLFASVSMTRVNPHLFVNQAQTDFEAIKLKNEGLKRKIVQLLFETDVIMHENSHSFNRDASFSDYYNEKHKQFSLIDLDLDGEAELIFQGYVVAGDEKEFTEIYQISNGKYDLIYTQVGYLLAYKIHPNTKEVVLYQHQYPCCSSLSHNIHVLRLLDRKIRSNSKLFLARDSGMIGNFFPKNCHFDTPYKKLNKTTMLYWSDSIIKKNASLSSQSNAMIHYPKGSVYRVLAKRKSWSYILIRGNAAKEKSLVINAENISKMAVFAWIKTQ